MPVFGAKWLEKCKNAPKSQDFGAFLCDCGGGDNGGGDNGQPEEGQRANGGHQGPQGHKAGRLSELQPHKETGNALEETTDVPDVVGFAAKVEFHLHSVGDLGEEVYLDVLELV